VQCTDNAWLPVCHLSVGNSGNTARTLRTCSKEPTQINIKILSLQRVTLCFCGKAAVKRVFKLHMLLYGFIIMKLWIGTFKKYRRLLKLQSAVLFAAISVWNLKLQSFVELLTLHELYFGMTQRGWTQCLRRLWGCQSSCQCGYGHSESQIILFGNMTNFHRKISSEQVRNIHFCSGSDIAVNSAD